MRWPAPPAVQCNVDTPVTRAGLLLCGEGSGGVVALDLATGTPVGSRFDFQHGSLYGLATSADGNRLIETSPNSPLIAEWRLDGGGPISKLVLPGADLTVQSYDQRRRVLVTVPASAAGPAHPELIDPASGSVADPLTGIANATGASADWLVASFVNGTHGFYNVATGQRIASPGQPLGFVPDSVTAVGNRLIAWSSTEGRAQGVDPVTGTAVAPTIKQDEPLINLSFDPTTATLLVTDASGLTRRDLRTGAITAGPLTKVWQVAVARSTVVAGAGDGSLLVLDATHLQPEPPSLPGVIGLPGVSLSDDGQRLLVIESEAHSASPTCPEEHSSATPSTSQPAAAAGRPSTRRPATRVRGQ